MNAARPAVQLFSPYASVAIVLTEMDDSVGVDVAIREIPWNLPYPAFRVSDHDSIQIGPALSSLNLFGQGMGVSGRALFGGASSYQVEMNWPWITANHLSLELFSGHILRDDSLRNFGETSDELTLWVGTFIGRKWRARRTRRGFGFGMRPIVPGVGGVRLDLGFNADSDVVFHLGVLPKMDAQLSRLR